MLLRAALGALDPQKYSTRFNTGELCSSDLNGEVTGSTVPQKSISTQGIEALEAMH